MLTRSIAEAGILSLLDALDWSRVVAWAMTPVWNDEPLVDPGDRIEEYHEELNCEVEGVEAGLRMVPCWVCGGPRNVRCA